MAQTVLSYCNCCGQAVVFAGVEICPNCQYPLDPENEQHFLETSIRDLGRVMRYGGASITVAALVRRYEGRLQFLLHLKAQQADSLSVASPLSANLPTQAAGREQELSVVHPARDLAQPAAPVFAPPNAPARVGGNTRGFSFSSDALINLVATLGGFLVLAGSLSFVLTTSSLWLSFVAVFLLHAVFGGTGVFTRRRFPLLRAVSTLYTLIFVLLVPLVGFSAYRLATNGLVELSTSQLLVLASLYATVMYGLLAVAQRFAPFAYLGMIALLVGDLALAQTLQLAYWWWPCMAMLLALLGLLATSGSSPGNRFFAGERAILRVPLLVLMYTVVWAIVPLAFLIILGSSLLQDNQGQSVQEMRLSLLCLSCLVFLWASLWIWRARRLKGTPLLAYLLLGTFLLLGYVLNLDQTGYVVLLAAVVLLYHALVRAARMRLAPYGFPGLALDQLAIGLSALVMLLVAFAIPFQMLYRAYAGSPAQGTLSFLVGSTFPLSFVPGAGIAFDLLALGLCLLVTVDITLTRAGLSKIPTRAGWCWLLLLSGFLLSSICGLLILLWDVESARGVSGLEPCFDGLRGSGAAVRRFRLGQSTGYPGAVRGWFHSRAEPEPASHGAICPGDWLRYGAAGIIKRASAPCHDSDHGNLALPEPCRLELALV